MNAAQVLTACLKAEGVDTIFGLPGGAALPTYDALYDAGIRHILCRHEQGAGFAAEGYAKASGKVACVCVSSGPGATNLITSIADAMLDSVPVVYITGQVRTDLLGTDGFQEADITGITMPIVKHSILITDPADLPQGIHEAFHIAGSGRPGPVVVDIPTDLARADLPLPSQLPAQLHLPGYQPKLEGNAKQIRLAAEAMAMAKRPIIYAGGGVVNANASAHLRELAHVSGFPVTCTLMGLGAFPAADQQWLGMLGMHGTRAANYAIDQSDLIIAVGARFDDRITGLVSEFAPAAKIIHIDVDAAEISKIIAAHIPIVGDCAHILPPLTAALRELAPEQERLRLWWERIREWMREYPLAYEFDKTTIKPQYLIQALYAATDDGQCILTSDVGQHQMWAAQHFHFQEPRQWINSGGLGAMGFGLPAAMGAQLARPGELVVCISGDGSVQMNAQELATCRQNDIPIKIVIMNNGYLGMVRQWQELFWDNRYSQVDLGQWPDFLVLAQAYGATGFRFDNPQTLIEDLRTALATDGPVLVDVAVTKEESVYPMIAAGTAARDMVG
jgi:acetolactate synthase-1/2/3 large subunit